MSKDDAIVILQTSAINSYFLNMFTEFDIHHYQYRVLYAHAIDSNFSNMASCYLSFKDCPAFSLLQDAYDYAVSLQKKIVRETGPIEYGVLISQIYKHLTFNQLKISYEFGGKMIELYTRADCEYCVKAKELLTENKLEYREYEIGKDIDRDSVLQKFPSAKLLPVVAIDGQYVGGYNELISTVNGNSG